MCEFEIGYSCLKINDVHFYVQNLLAQEALNVHANHPSSYRLEYLLSKRFQNIRITFAV